MDEGDVFLGQPVTLAGVLKHVLDIIGAMWVGSSVQPSLMWHLVRHVTVMVRVVNFDTVL